MHRFSKTLVLVSLVGFAAVSSQASVTAGKNWFGQGRTRLSIYGGAASNLNQTYGLIGIGAGYFILNGLEAGIDGEVWFGNDPNIYKITPEVRYVFWRMQRIKPYVGGFYRRTIYEHLDDVDSYGGRAGLFTAMGGHAYAGVGMVYERLANCNETKYKSCDSSYPEISFSVGF